MASVLAGQLQSLARQRQPALQTTVKRGRPSLLFDFHKAADVDLLTLFNIAIQGLEELISMEPRFRPYRDSLFSRAGHESNPEMQTTDYNIRLGESVYGFCCLLTNYFLTPSAFKVLEYLIRRYRSNEKHVDALMTSALPYHSTNEFVRLVQTLTFQHLSPWKWLSKMQSSGASLPRDVLVARCVNARPLLLFICKSAGQFGGVAGSGPAAPQVHSRTYQSFYAVLLCEVLAVLPAVEEDLLAALLPYLLDGLGKSATQDYRAATLMVLAELFSRATLGEKFLKVILNTMLKNTERVADHVRTVLLVMAHMALTQKHIQFLSDKTIKYLSALPNMAQELATLSQRGNIRAGPLLILLVRSLSSSLTGSGPSSSSGQRCKAELIALAHAGALCGEPAGVLASSLLEAGSVPAADETVRECCRMILRVLDQRYPDTTDSAVNIFLEPIRNRMDCVKGGKGPESCDDAAEKTKGDELTTSVDDHARFEFVRDTFISCYSALCGETMMTLVAALSAPQAAFRRLALEQLDTIFAAAASSPTDRRSENCEVKTALTSAALSRLRDDDLGVTVAALGLSILNELPPTALLDALDPLVDRLGEYLYGPAKLPLLKLACTAACMVVDLLRRIGSMSEGHKLQSAVRILTFVQPSRRDPIVSVKAAQAASALDLPLFSWLPEKIANQDPVCANSKDKLLSALEQNVISALSKALLSEPDACCLNIQQLLSATATATASSGFAAQAAARRIHRVLLLASFMAAACASDSERSRLLRFVVDMALDFLPYCGRIGVEFDWQSKFDDMVSPEGLTAERHLISVETESVSAHTALILGVLRSTLEKLPDAGAISHEDTAKCILGRLSTCSGIAADLRDLPLLVLTRFVEPSSRSSFLSSIFAAQVGEEVSASMQCLALYIRSRLDENITTAGTWLISLLVALGSVEATVRSAACDCMAAILHMITSADQPDRQAPGCLSIRTLEQLCSRLLLHKNILCRDRDAVRMLLQEALCAGSTSPRSPTEVARQERSVGLALPDIVLAELASYLASSLDSLTVDAAGISTASMILTCTSSPESSTRSLNMLKAPALILAGMNYMSKLVEKLSNDPASATMLDASVVEDLTDLIFGRNEISALLQNEQAVRLLAETAELLPTPSDSTPQATTALAACRLSAIRHVKEVFVSLLADGRGARTLFAVLLSRYETDPDDGVRAAARSALETIPLAADILVPLLVIMTSATPSSHDLSNGRHQKRSKTSTAPMEVASLKLERADLQNAVSVLELLQWRTDISSPYLLVTACQSLLRCLLPIAGSLSADEVVEKDASSLAGYAASLALQVLTTVAPIVETDGKCQLDLELAVLAALEAPDVVLRNAALGLLAVLASKMPEAALSHVLQVIAFVNKASAQKDDEYSRAMYATVLRAVVPAWVMTGQRSMTLWEQVVSSLPSLPPHRRLDVLLALLRAMPLAEEWLSVGLLVILKHTAEADSKQHPQDVGVSDVKEVPASDWLPGLASQLALQVDLPSRLNCFAQVMTMALTESCQQPQEPLPRTVVAFVTVQLKLKVSVASASASFRRPEPNLELDIGCRRLMEAALAQIQLLHPDEPGRSVLKISAGKRQAVVAASRSMYALFSALQGVMAADTYLQALLTLTEHPADKVRRRALKLFNEKILRVRSEIEDEIELPQRVRAAKLRQTSDAAALACVMIPSLLKASADASPLTRQLAIVVLASIAVEFGALQPDALLTSLPAVLDATRDQHASIRATSLTTVAAFVKVLGSNMVPLLPATVESAVVAANLAWARLERAGDAAAHIGKEMLDATDLSSSDHVDSDGLGIPLRSSCRSEADQSNAALELSSALASLSALVEAVGGFLSPHLSSVLGILLNPRVLACTIAGCDKFAASIRGRLPTVIVPRLLLPCLSDMLEPSLSAAADTTVDAGSDAAAASSTVTLLKMVGATAAALEPKVAVQYCDIMFSFLLRALDVRHCRPVVLAAHGEAAIDAVEAAAIAAFVDLVMKLSETRFKPLFLRLVEWASMTTVNTLGRMVTLFGVVNALTDRLRAVLVPYYRHLLDICVKYLPGEGEIDGKAGRFMKKLRRSSEAEFQMDLDLTKANAHKNEQLELSWLLRLRIVRALHRCFLNDTVGFLDAGRFTRLQKPLVSLLATEQPATVIPLLLSPQNTDPELASYVMLGQTTSSYTAHDGELSQGPIGAATIGCLLAMVVAVNNDALWRPLNHAVLMQTRSSEPRTRALALEMVAQMVGRLREEYLVLLPEALPFLSELLEDVVPALSVRVREVIVLLEEISGEKLDEYLKI